jgi:hypothetical protein
MRWNTFPRSVLFAALAAGSVLPWLLLARPAFGAERALVLYLVGVVAAYLGGLAPTRGRRVAVFVAAACVAVGVAVVARTATELVLGLGAVLALGRSAFLYQAPATRAVLTEAVLVGGGLLFARFLIGHSLLALVLALWGFSSCRASTSSWAASAGGPDRVATPTPFKTPVGGRWRC